MLERELASLDEEDEVLQRKIAFLRHRLARGVGASEEFQIGEEIRAAERSRKRIEVRQLEIEAEIRSIPLHNLPCPPNPALIQRSPDLDAIDRQFQGSGLSYACIQGLPGVGKTLLSIQFAYRHIDTGIRYQTVVWVECPGKDLSAAFAKAASDLGLVPGRRPRDDELIRALRVHLETEPGPHLLILDSVTSPASYAAYLPRSGNCHVLITSRLRELPYCGRPLRLEVLRRADSLRLLCGPTPLPETEEAAAQDLAEALGDLPLALALVNRVHQGGLRSLDELRRSIKNAGTSKWIPDVAVEGISLPYNNLPALFDVSYELLSDDARLVAAAAGHFATAPIARDLLSRAGALLCDPSAPADEDRWISAIEWCLRVGLFDRLDGDDDFSRGAGPSLRAHVLVQDYLRSKHDDRARGAVCDALAEWVRRTPLLIPRILDLRPHLPHLERMALHLREDDPPSRYLVVLGLVYHHCLIGAYHSAIQLCDRHLPRMSESPEAAKLRHQKGYALRCLGAYEAALAEHQQVLAWRRANLEEGDMEISFSQYEIALVHLLQARHQEALDGFQQVLQRFSAQLHAREVLGAPATDLIPLKIGRGFALPGLARARLGLSSSPEDLARCAQECDESLEIFTALGLADALFATHAMLARARVHLAQQHPDEAEALIARACRIREALLSREHAYLIEIYELRGRLCAERGDAQGARDAYEEALRLTRLLGQG